MERIKAEELIDRVVAASMPWMEAEDQSEVMGEIQRRASGQGGREEKWGGGYGSNVDSVSMDSFRQEAERGVSSG